MRCRRIRGRRAATCRSDRAARRPGRSPYDPFAQAWTAEHDWGLTEADLAELAAEQEGEAAYAEALRAALEQQPAGDDAPCGDAAQILAPSGPAAPPRRQPV